MVFERHLDLLLRTDPRKPSLIGTSNLTLQNPP